MTDVKKITDIQIGYITVLGNIASLFGIYVYSIFLRDMEFRNLFFINILVLLMGNVSTMAFIHDVHLKYSIGHYEFLAFQTIVFGCLNFAFYGLPYMVLITKLIPTGIEGTTIALLMGLRNLCMTMISPYVGSMINDNFIHLTKKNMSNDKMALVCEISTVIIVISIPYILLLPTRK
jgi:hypothetical protein